MTAEGGSLQLETKDGVQLGWLLWAAHLGLYSE